MSKKNIESKIQEIPQEGIKPRFIVLTWVPERAFMLLKKTVELSPEFRCSIKEVERNGDSVKMDLRFLKCTRNEFYHKFSALYIKALM